jgi:formate-dependent phosphoribosylglycinamide formyltransferase (GAR transformylase)
MHTVVFVAPYFIETTMRFVAAAAQLSGVRFALVAHEPEEKLPPELRPLVAAYVQVGDCLDPRVLAQAVESIAARIGKPDRLIGTLEELQVPLAEVRAHFGIPGLSVEAAQNFRDKSRMKDVLRAAGVPCARHRLCDDAAGCRSFAGEIGFPLVVKPPAGAGARNTFRVDTAHQLEEWLAASPPAPGRAAMLEEFVVGREHSFDSVTIGGHTVWSSISRYDPTPLEVLRNPWIQWCVVLPRDVSGPEFAAIREMGPRAIAALGMGSGITHMEWFRRGDGRIAISEVAARPPGAQFTTLISYAHDLDLYRAWARVVVCDAFEPAPRKYAVGAAYLRGQGSGRVKAVHGLDQARDVGPLVVESRLPKPGQPHAGTYEGDGFVIVRHPETAMVERALSRIINTIRVELVD